MTAEPRRHPRLAVTMGDPAGVGPELCLRLLNQSHDGYTPLVFGDATILEKVAGLLELPMSTPVVSAAMSAAGPAIVHCPTADLRSIVPGRVQASCGEAAVQYCLRAISETKRAAVDGIITCPINKEAIYSAGYPYPGHTELFAEQFADSKTCMMQYASDIACSFVTTHIGYTEVCHHLTAERIADVIELTNDALNVIRGTAPKLLVCGLNPHAGENGRFGNREEELLILPAIKKVRKQGFDITGPVPADTAFTPQSREKFDAVICMYHDQGHIPIKMIAFDRAVNVTLGLSAIRTSVDHGTAFDIAWTGKADPGSLFQAVRLAANLSKTVK